MLIEIDGWSFEVDEKATGDYSAAELAEHCTCGYCLNFYETVDTFYPNLRRLLQKLGIKIEAPDELMPYDIGNQMYCDATYSVCGKILRCGVNPILIDGLAIQPHMSENVALCYHCPEPYFVLRIGTIVLPWILDHSTILS